MKLTPEDLARIEEKKVANILRKIYTEKRTPTAREDAILHRAGVVQASGNLPAPLTGYAMTWDELAQALGVTRRAIQEWRRDPRYAAHCPPDRADGRKEVAGWFELMSRFGLKRATVSGDGDDEQELAGVIHPPAYGGSQSDWTKAKIAKDVERKDIEILGIKGTLLEAAELEVPLGATFASIQTKLAQFPARVARYLVGLRDVGEVEDRLRDEIDADLSDLHAARFTAEQAVAAAVDALPFNEESERLFKLVSFDGQDRTALLQLITAVAGQALRQLGRRAVAIALREKEVPDTAIADAATGQVTDEATAREHAHRSAAQPSALEAAPPPAQPPAVTRKGKTRKKPRPKVPPAPAEVEASIHARPRTLTRRKRR